MHDMCDFGFIWDTWCWSKFLYMILTMLVMMMYEVKHNDYVLFVSLHGLCEVMGLHIHIALVDLYWGYDKVLWCIDEYGL